MKQFVIDNAETPISLENAVFLFCKDLPAVKALDIHEHKQIAFQTGAGTTIAKITRVPDAEPRTPINWQSGSYCSKCGSVICQHESEAK